MNFIRAFRKGNFHDYSNKIFPTLSSADWRCSMTKLSEYHAYICWVLEQAEQNAFNLTDAAYQRYLEGCKLVGRTPFPIPAFASYRQIIAAENRKVQYD